MSFGLFTACYGYERWLPEWEASVAELNPAPDEVVIVGDEAARAAWGGIGTFVLAPQHGQPFNQAAAFNAAMAVMGTEWAMHVGVDDLCAPHIVADLSAKFDDADIVACDVRSERDGRLVRVRKNRPTAQAILTPTSGQQALDACAAFRRSLWEQAPYDERFNAGGCDVALWIGFAKLGARFAWSGTVGVRYRLHDDSLWHSRSRESLVELRGRLNQLREADAPMPSLSVAIMAHPSRRQWVEELERTLDRPAKVVWDEHNDIWDTGRRALLAYDPAATHHLVIQDDVIPCRDLVAGVERALEHVPSNALVGLYAGYPRPAQDPMRQLIARTRTDTAWLVLPRINWGPAVVVPTCHIESIVAFGDKQDIRSYDQRIGRWCKANRVPAWHTWPCLVEHRDIPSLLGRRPGRHAYRFIGADASALEHNWSGGTVSPEDVPEYALWRDRRSQRVQRVRMGSLVHQRLAAAPQYERVVAGHCGECGHRVYTPFEEDADVAQADA